MKKFDYVIRNGSGRAEIVSIEPWADEFTLEPESRLEVEIFYYDEGALEVVIGDGVHSVWTWKTAHARVVMNGNQDGAVLLD